MRRLDGAPRTFPNGRSPNGQARGTNRTVKAIAEAAETIAARLEALDIQTVESHSTELGLIAAELRGERADALGALQRVREANAKSAMTREPRRWGEEPALSEVSASRNYLGAVTASLAVLDRSSKLHGLDAPARIKVYEGELADAERESGIPASKIAAAVEAALAQDVH